MATKTLSNMAVSIFCENMAMMLAAGIGPDEAAGLLCGDSDATGELNPAARAVQDEMLLGSTFAAAIKASGAFPAYMADMVAAGEKAGRTEQVLRTLAAYYEGRDKLQKRLKSAVIYPIILLLLMTVILIFLVARLLPVFTGVYRTVAGELTASAYWYINFASVLGWVALGITALLTALLLVGCVLARNTAGQARLIALCEKFGPTAQTSRLQALAGFTRVLSIFVASGLDTDTSVSAAAKLVTHSGLRAKLEKIEQEMQAGKGAADAFYENEFYAPLYGRMLLSGARSGQTEQVLAHLADIYDEESDRSMDALLGSIEPALSFFLTVAVGLTLLAAMLPLIGILGAIG